MGHGYGNRAIGADPPVWRRVGARVTALNVVEPEADDFSEVLRNVLRTELLRGECSVEDLAEQCMIHRRTLSRRLRAEGTAYRRLTDEVRFEIACRLLSNRSMTFAQIATTLGYSEASAFTRAFRRWSGQSPAAWRSEHGSAQSGHRPPRSPERARP